MNIFDEDLLNTIKENPAHFTVVTGVKVEPLEAAFGIFRSPHKN